MLASIREVLIISTPDDISDYEKLLGDGSQIGISIQYKIQDHPRGLADAFILGEEFIGDDSVCLILGDNVFYGQSMTQVLHQAMDNKAGATIFGYPVKDPRSFGVVEFDENYKVLSIEEKPQNPKSNYAVPGLYFYDNRVVEIAKNVKPSARGEIEITAVNNAYLEMGELNVTLLGRGMAWLDTGTPEGMLKAAEFVEAVQDRQGFYVSCIEEIAWRRKFITTEQLLAIGESLKMTEYGSIVANCALRIGHYKGTALRASPVTSAVTVPALRSSRRRWKESSVPSRSRTVRVTSAAYSVSVTTPPALSTSCPT
jgi:glucose-1-phosphate thymidylyltransferase